MKLTKQQLKNIKEQFAHPDENRIANTIKKVEQLLNKLEDQKSNTCKKRRPIKTEGNESDSDSFCGTGYAREDDDVPNEREREDMGRRLRQINEGADQEALERFERGEP